MKIEIGLGDECNSDGIKFLLGIYSLHRKLNIDIEEFIIVLEYHLSRAKNISNKGKDKNECNI